MPRFHGPMSICLKILQKKKRKCTSFFERQCINILDVCKVHYISYLCLRHLININYVKKVFKYMIYKMSIYHACCIQYKLLNPTTYLCKIDGCIYSKDVHKYGDHALCIKYNFKKV